MRGDGRRPSSYPQMGAAGGEGGSEEERGEPRHADHPCCHAGGRRHLQLHGVQQRGQPRQEVHQHPGQRYEMLPVRTELLSQHVLDQKKMRKY